VSEGTRAFRVHPGMNRPEREAVSRSQQNMAIPGGSTSAKDESSMFIFLIFSCSRWQLAKRRPTKHRFRFKRIQDLRRDIRGNARGLVVSGVPIVTNRNSRVGPAILLAMTGALSRLGHTMGSHQPQPPRRRPDPAGGFARASDGIGPRYKTSATLASSPAPRV
jgi:hypothetical protein